MNLLGWILLFFFSLIVFTIGSSRFWKSLFKPPHYWRGENTNEKSAEWLVSWIGKAKKSVYIVSGNLNPHVFDPVADTIPEKLKEVPDLKIKILTAANILALKRKGKLENKLFNLTIDQDFIRKFGERFQIAYLKERPVTHYRVIDTSHLYVEEPHDIGVSRRLVEILERSIFKSWQYERHFGRLWQASDVVKPLLVPLNRATEGGV